MQAVIIAGGLGTRLGELTKNNPKSMVLVNGKPFIEYQIEFLREKGINNIVICIGHLGQQILEYCRNGYRFGVNLQYSYENKLAGTAGALKLAEPLLEEFFFTLYGDSYVFFDFKNLMEKFITKKMSAVMSVYKNNNQFDRSNTAIKNGMVINYDKNTTKKYKYIEYGVNYFEKKTLQIIPEAQTYSMGDFFNDLIKLNLLYAYEVKDRFYEIGSLYGLRDFEDYLRSLYDSVESAC
jgi:N-acetyl-alpha-D-muramate 1-phosphate uridylyltransferase